MERIEPVLKPQRVVPAAFAHGLLEIRAELGRDIGTDRDAADPTHCAETERHVVVAGELAEILAAADPLGGDAGEVSCRILHRDDLRVFSDLAQGFDRYVGDRPGGHIVDDNGNWRGIGDGGEMSGEAGLARLVVIRDDREDRVGAKVGGRARPLDRRFRIVGAGPGDHWYTAVRRANRGRDHLAMLVRVQRRHFAGGSAGNQAIRPLIDLPFDECGK